DALPGDDAARRRHLVVGLQPLLDPHGQSARRIEVVVGQHDEISFDAGAPGRLRGRRGALHDQLRHAEAERVLGVAVVRVAAVADSVAVDVRLIRVGDARTVVSAVDDPVTVAVDTARAWRADPALAGARAPADRSRTAGGSVRLTLAVGRAAITR